ncbi:host specificity factor TipJ family phage tail protein [Bradyrhizobium sp. Ai1a-2]|uniref:host specificity factor TipJ family phage tail protein n=1 Tax=Bradyrhizobium sp. Ai1a-2 TaxID=196490 RepID=UPI000424EB0F|nr:host specificity factor TipJ family phage tail protein [Bradyrhizobium sp. Ai1a-2]
MHRTAKKFSALPTPQRSRARRERRSDAARQPVLHVVTPGLEVARETPRKGETVTAFLRRSGWATHDRKYGWEFRKGLPTILEINGEAVLRKDWRRRRISANDNVRFVSHPLGGGGSGDTAKQVVGLVALIAVSAFALWAGPALFGAGTFGAYATTAGLGIAGALAINALTAPKPGATNAPDATQDQIYSASAQGNVAKLGQPLPVWYGRLKRYPDLAATPWSEFVGNDQYLNILLSVTMGSLEYERLFIDDTVLWDFVTGISASYPGAQVAFYEPGQQVTLFPTNVAASDEVTGQQLPDGSGTTGGFFVPATGTSPGAWIGPFAANPPGTQAQSLAVDFVMPAGCATFNQTNNGGRVGYGTVPLTAEYCQIDDAGTQISSFVPLFSAILSYGSTSPIRDSRKVDVAPGRYAVRFRRNDAAFDSSLGSNQVVWAGLRAFLKGDNSFPDVSTVAIRLLASQSTQGSFKFGVLGTRKLPVWNGSSFVTQATRNPGWVFLDAVTNAQYGSGLPISKVDFNAVVAFAAGCTSRSDTFNYCFTTAVAVPEAFDKALTVARSRHFWLGDTVSVVRDEWRDVPTMLLTDREIVRDSTQVTITQLGEDDPDAVIVEYIDENTWLAAQVQYPPNSPTFTAQNAETKRIDGGTDRNQMFRECAFWYLQSIYRREAVQIGTEYEGRAITFGSVLRVQSELPEAYGYGGAVVAVDSNELTLSPAPVWDSGPFYIRLRRPNGKFFGPVLAGPGSSAAIAVLDAASLAAAESSQSTTLAAVLAREDGGEDPSFELGTGVSSSKLCMVLSGQPNGELCTLSLVVDDQRVHATDLGTPPVLPVGQFPANDKVPLIVGLNAMFSQGIAEPVLAASWFPSAGAIYYIADVSYDSGNSWIQVYEGADNKFDNKVVTPAALRLRVQAVTSLLRGPYATVDLSAPTVEIASGAVALKSLIDGIKYQITTLMNEINDKIVDINQRIAAIADKDASDWIDREEIRSQLAARGNAASAEINEVRLVAVGTADALASFSQEVTATFGPAFSSVKTVSQAVATLDGYAAASWSIMLNVNGAWSGIQLVDGSDSESVINLLASNVKISLPGFNGDDPYDLFATGLVGGVPSVGINGNLILNGTITAVMMNVGTLSAISVNAGDIRAGTLADPTASRMFIDLNNARITVSDNT